MVEVPVEEWSRYTDPSTETYKFEVIAQQTTAYSVSVSARSKKVLAAGRLQSFSSEAGLNKVAIRAGSRNSVLLNYSRDPQEKVTHELQHVLNAQRR